MVSGLNERLQEQRLLRNLSQKEVASILGKSVSIISNYESGARTPSAETLIALAHLYHCSTDYLLGLNKVDNTHLDLSMLNEKQSKLLQAFLFSIKK